MAVRYRLFSGPGSWPAPIMGTIDLETPTLIDYGGAEVGVRYGAAGSFAAGAITHAFTGIIHVHDQGAGLWDTTFQLPITTSDGRSFHWESTHGEFFTAAEVPYPPAMGTSSIAYSVHPEKIHFLSSAFHGEPGLGHGTLIAERTCDAPELPGEHLKGLEKRITALSDALANLGRGTDLRELLRIIRTPGWTTPAELAFCVALLDDMASHAHALESLSGQLLAASRLVASPVKA